MLPDYRRTKNIIERHIRRIMVKRAKLISPVLSHAPAMFLHEGLEFEVVRSDGTSERTKLKKARAKIVITDDEVTKSEASILVKRMLSVADDLSNQITQSIFTDLGKGAESVGNIVKTKGGIVTPETILEALSLMWIDFDKNGKPQLPIITPSRPSIYHQQIINKAWSDLFDNCEYKIRFDKIMVVKREEYRARESNRRLVE